MRTYRVGQVADLLGVSTDTVRRWADSGRLAMRRGRRPAPHRRRRPRPLPHRDVAGRPSEPLVTESARNRFPGIVTKVEKEGLVAVVHIQAGPHRVVSLMTREAADELALEPGDLRGRCGQSHQRGRGSPAARMTIERGARVASACDGRGARRGRRAGGVHHRGLRRRASAATKRPSCRVHHGVGGRVAHRGVHQDGHRLPEGATRARRSRSTSRRRRRSPRRSRAAHPPTCSRRPTGPTCRRS